MRHRRTRAPAAALPLLLLPLGAGCASGFARDRALDLADCFSASAAAGLELSADVQATDLLHLGVGGGAHGEAGFVGRRYGTAGVVTIHLPVAPVVEQVAYGRFPVELGGTWTTADVQDECYAIHVLDVAPTNPRRPWIDRFDLEVGAVALVGGRLGVRPGQVLDFLAGWLGLDPAEDDAGARSAPPAAAPTRADEA